MSASAFNCSNITPFNLWKIPLYIHERIRMNKANNVSVVLQTCSTSQILPPGNLPPRSKDLQRCLDHSIGTTVLDHILGVSCFFHVQRTLSLYKYWPPSEYQILFWVLEMQMRINLWTQLQGRVGWIERYICIDIYIYMLYIHIK